MSEKKSRPVFSAEFKADAVELVLASKESVSAVARQLDVSDGALRRWVKDVKLEHPEHDDGMPGSVDWQKYKALEARNRELERSNEFLKKFRRSSQQGNGRGVVYRYPRGERHRRGHLDVRSAGCTQGLVLPIPKYRTNRRSGPA